MAPRVTRLNACRSWVRVAGGAACVLVATAVVVAVAIHGDGRDPTPRAVSVESTTMTAPVVTTVPATSLPPTTVPLATTTTQPGRGLVPADPAWRITFEGIGPVKLGMTKGQAQVAGNVELVKFPQGDYAPCYIIGPYPAHSPTGQPDDSKLTPFGFVDDVLQFVWTKDAALSTDRGIRVGSTTDQVLAAYPDATRRIRYYTGLRPLVATDGNGHVLMFMDGGYEIPKPSGPPEIVAPGTTGVVRSIAVLFDPGANAIYECT